MADYSYKMTLDPYPADWIDAGHGPLSIVFPFGEVMTFAGDTKPSPNTMGEFLPPGKPRRFLNSSNIWIRNLSRDHQIGFMRLLTAMVGP